MTNHRHEDEHPHPDRGPGAEQPDGTAAQPDGTAAPANPEATDDEPAPLDDRQQTRKDVSYSPASERETAAKQSDPVPDRLRDDVDVSRIRAVPGTGGPDDAGDVDLPDIDRADPDAGT